MIAYRIEKLSESGDHYTDYSVMSEPQMVQRFGETEAAQMIAGTHPTWHLAETLEVPDPPATE